MFIRTGNNFIFLSRTRSSYADNLDNLPPNHHIFGPQGVENYRPESRNSENSSKSAPQVPSSPTGSKKSSPHQTRRNIPKGIAKIKDVSQATILSRRLSSEGMQEHQDLHDRKMAQISAVPRPLSGKIKVSDGTQTDFQSSNLNIRLLFNNFINSKLILEPPGLNQYRSLSLTGQGATHLSQSIKDRFGTGTQSLPKNGLDMHAVHYRFVSRLSIQLIHISILSFLT